MTKRFVIDDKISLDEDKVDTYELSTLVDKENKTFYFIVDSLENVKIFCERLNDLADENEQLKQQLYDCKKDEKQLSISFMEFKMQLIEVLQQNYNYAYNQRQKNLDGSIIARTYEVLYQTIYNIAETMNVDIERFPKGDDVE